MVVDLDDTSACPIDSRCWACETTTDLDVVTLPALAGLAGVYCLTLCGDCVASGQFPTKWPATFERIKAHCAHLGIDLNHMAHVVIAMDAEAHR